MGKDGRGDGGRAMGANGAATCASNCGLAKKALSVFLSVVLVVGLWPSAAFAGDGLTAASAALSLQDSPSVKGDMQTQSDGETTPIVIDAKGSDTITVEAPSSGGEDEGDDDGESEESSGYGDVLSISADKQKIQRDYSQVIHVQVSNESDMSTRYYLKSVNNYEDIYMNFVEGGSKGAPLTIQPGETQLVDLSVFAQNAQLTSYTIHIEAFLVDDPGGIGEFEDGPDCDASMYYTFDCEASGGRVALNKGQVSETTLAVDYTVTNTGSEKITDITASLEGEAADYARITPAIENFELGVGRSVACKVVPDLAKMKADGKANVGGALVISGGAAARSTLSFDTSGKEITASTMGEIALVQDDNPYVNMDLDDETLTITGRDGVSFSDITKKYFDEDDPNNPDKNGVDTQAEFAEVLHTFISEDGMIDLAYEDEVTYGDNETMKTSFSISTEVIEESEESEESELTPQSASRNGLSTQAASNGTKILSSTTAPDGKGNVVTTTTFQMAFDEYVDVLEEVNDVASELNIEGADNLTLRALGIDTEANTGRKVRLKVVDKVESAALGFPDEFSSISLDTWLYERHLRDTYSGYNKFAQSAIIQGGSYKRFVDTMGKTTGAISTGIDVYKTANDAYRTVKVWNNPKISGGTKVNYAALQTMRAVNRFAGGKILSKGGAWLGGAIADGPGAIVGYFLGHVASGLIGIGLDNWIESMEEDMEAEGGSALYYDIYGHQCTNAGRVQSDFYLPDYTGGGSGGSDGTGGGSGVVVRPRVTETGRMYDGTDGDNYYVDESKVGYDYTINGEPVATSTNNGLTQVVIVDLSDGSQYLNPGKNTIVRDYDTNPGTHYVTADSEITVIYPPDTPVSYIGEPDEMEEVRLLPDFAVYRENISLEGEAVKGETVKAKAYVYNRGSLGGWVTIDITDGSKSLYHEADVYMPAFSEKQVEFDWTPAAVGEASIGVKLTNRSLVTDERKMTNNAAAHTFTVREREVPEIGEISPASLHVDAGESAYVSVVVDKIADVKQDGVSVSLDGTALTDVAFVRTSDSKAQLSAKIASASPGKHTLKVTVPYATASGSSTVEKSHELDVQGRSTMSVKVDSTIVNPAFYAVDKEDSRKQELRAIRGEEADGATSYTLTETAAMENADLSDYLLMVRADGGLLFVDWTSADAKTLTLSDGHKLTVIGDGQVGCAGITVEYCRVSDGVWVYTYNVGTFQSSEIVLSGVDQVDVYTQYRVADETSSIDWWNVDVMGDVTLDFSEKLRVYTFDMSSTVRHYGGDSEPYFPYFGITMMADGASLGWAYRSYRNEDDHTYTVIVEDESTIEKIDAAKEVTAYLYEYGGSVMYQAAVGGAEQPITPSTEGNCTVTFSLNDAGGDSEIYNVNTAFTLGYDSITMYGDEISVPAGTYDMSISYTVDGNRGFTAQTVDATGSSAQVVLNYEKQPTARLKVTWPESLGYNNGASVYCHYYDDGGKGYSFNASNGEAVEVPVGECTVSVTLYDSMRRDYGDDYYYDSKYLSLYKSITLEEGKEIVLDVPTEYAGSVEHSPSRPLNPGSSVYLDFNRLSGGDETALTRISPYDDEQLYGEAVFTDVSNRARTFTSTFATPAFDMYDGITVKLPYNIDPGEYSYTVHLSTEGSAVDEGTFYRIATSVEGSGTISPASPSVQEGKAQSLTFTPNKGYLVKDVVVDGESLGAIDSYTFKNVAEDHTVSVQFISESAVVKGVSLDQSQSPLELEKGASEILVASITPEGAADKTVTWSSGDKKVATVDANGVVTANSVGTTVITVATHDGGYKAARSVRVYQREALNADTFGDYFDVTTKLGTAVGDDVAGSVAVAPKESATSLPANAVSLAYYAVGVDEGGNEELRLVEGATFTEAGDYVVKATVTGEDPKLELPAEAIEVIRFKVAAAAPSVTVTADTSSLYEESAQESLAQVMNLEGEGGLRVESFPPLSLDTLQRPDNSALNQELSQEFAGLQDGQAAEIVIAPRFAPVTSSVVRKAAAAKAIDAMNLRGDRSTAVKDGMFMLDISMVPRLLISGEDQEAVSKELRSLMGDAGSDVVFSIPLADSIVSLLKAGASGSQTSTAAQGTGSKSVTTVTRYLRVYRVHGDGTEQVATPVAEYTAADLSGGNRIRLASRYYSTFVFSLEDVAVTKEGSGSSSSGGSSGGSGWSGGSSGGSSTSGGRPSTPSTASSKLVSIAALPSISVVNGTSLADIKSKLASKAVLTVMGNNGSTTTVDASITWGNDPAYDARSKDAQSLVFTGTVALPSGVTNSDGVSLTVTQKVDVEGASGSNTGVPGDASGPGDTSGSGGSSGIGADKAITQVTLSSDSMVYNGKVRRVLVKSVMAGSQAVPASAFTVSGGSGKYVGTYSVTVTAKQGSGYTGSATARFNITRAKSRVVVSSTMKRAIVAQRSMVVLRVSTPAAKKNVSISMKVAKRSLRKYVSIMPGKKIVKLLKGAKKGVYKFKVSVKGGSGNTYSNLKPKVYKVRVK